MPKIPGVKSVSLSQYSPMEGNNWSGPFSLEGRPLDPEHRISSSWLRVGPRYFETIGAQVLRGRAIDERDTATSLHVAVVNQAFADAFFPNEDPIGKHLGQGEEPGRAMDYEIVGIVENTKYVLAEEPAWRTYFLPLLQTVTFKVRGQCLDAGAVDVHSRHRAARHGRPGSAHQRASRFPPLARVDRSESDRERAC